MTTTRYAHDDLFSFWQKNRQGSYLREREQSTLASLCQSVSANQGLELSAAPSFGAALGVRHLVRWAVPGTCAPGTFIAHGTRLPFEDATFDMVLLHHLLETQSTPHHWLREAARVTSDKGRLRIVAWHPWGISAWRRVLPRCRHRLPYGAHWIGLRRIRDWLTFVDFEIERVDYCAMTALPSAHAVWLERWGRRFNLPLGMSMIITAHRHQASLIARSPRFKRQRLSTFGFQSHWGVTSSYPYGERREPETDSPYQQRNKPCE